MHANNHYNITLIAPCFQIPLDKVTSLPLSLSQCQPSSSWPSPSSSSSCFISLRPNQVVMVRYTQTISSSRLSPFFFILYLHFMIYLIIFFIRVCLSMCSMLFRTSCKISGSSNQQAGRQERSSW